MGCFLPARSEDQVDSPDPDHSAITLGAVTSRGSESVGDCRARHHGQREEAQGLGPSTDAGGPSLHHTCHHRRACLGGGAADAGCLLMTVSRPRRRPRCALRSVHHLPAAVPTRHDHHHCPQVLRRGRPRGGWGARPQGRASLLDLVSLLPRQRLRLSVSMSGNAMGG